MSYINIINSGVLRKCKKNPRYFTDDSGKAIYLTGSHTWATFQDTIPYEGEKQEEKAFDYDKYLFFMKEHNHNFLRMWCRESGFGGFGNGMTYPVAYKQVKNEDGKIRFDLKKLNPEYFDRLRARVIKAGEAGIYVSIMLFEGWSVDTRSRSPWYGHPYNKGNNINNIDGNPSSDHAIITLSQENDKNIFKPDEFIKVHTLEIPEITALQKNYVKRVVETLNDLDHVMYEICNEAFRWSRYWQYEMINYIQEIEKGLPKSHPVWMSHIVPAQNESLYVSNADAISPGVESTSKDYCINPPASDGRKIIIADTDHLGGIWGTAQWVWKTFMRGINPIFMDTYNQPDNIEIDGNNNVGPISSLFGRTQYELPDDWQEPVRVAMGQTLDFAKRIDLTNMIPYNDLSSTGYCLANPGMEYLIYQPEAGQFKLSLYGAEGPFVVEWFNPHTGEKIAGRSFKGGMAIEFTPPYQGEIVLYLKSKS